MTRFSIHSKHISLLSLSVQLLFRVPDLISPGNTKKIKKAAAVLVSTEALDFQLFLLQDYMVSGGKELQLHLGVPFLSLMIWATIDLLD